MSIFKKKQQVDPFAHLLQPEQPQEQPNFLRKVVTNKKKEEEEKDYSSPFRSQQELIAAKNVKAKKFPTVSATSGTASAADLGYKVIDSAKRRAKDISVPRYLKNTDEKQRKKLDKLEFKENHLQYLKDSQKIVDVRRKNKEEQSAAAAAADTADVVEKPEGIEEVEDVGGSVGKEEVTSKEHSVPELTAVEDTAEPTQELAEEPVEEPVEESVEELVQEPVQENVDDVASFTPSNSSFGVFDSPTDEIVEAVPILEGSDHEGGTRETTADDELQDDEPPIPKPDVIETTETHETTTGKEDQAEQGLEEGQAGGQADGLTQPIDPNKAPRVPFKAKTGVFALWTRSDKQDQPLATPQDPEYIVRTDKGYMSKAIYDKLEYDEQVHQNELATFNKEQADKYDATEKEYNDKLTLLQSQIDELQATMEQLRLDTKEKIKVSESELSKKMLDLNATHISSKNVIFKETENIKTQKIAERDEITAKHEEVKAEIEELNALKEQVDAEFNEYQAKLDDLTAQLDSKVEKIQELNDKQTEITGLIAELNQQKLDIETETRDAEELHKESTGILESIKNKEYLPKINAIDSQVATLLGSLTLIRQENANQKTEFAAITKRLEEERKAHEEKLRREEEERKRLEEERLQKQREELEAKAEDARLKHEEELRQIKEEHEKALNDANVQLAKEKEEREVVEREKTRLAGEKAIQEQERAQEADLALKQELMEKRRKQAEAVDAAEQARKISTQKKSVLSNPSQNLTRESSLYDYETVEEIITVDE